MSELYSISTASEILNISEFSVQEVKARLKIAGQMNQKDFDKVADAVNEIKRMYKRVTLSTINLYFDKF